jgi:hypothetical protein
MLSSRASWDLLGRALSSFGRGCLAERSSAGRFANSLVAAAGGEKKQAPENLREMDVVRHIESGVLKHSPLAEGIVLSVVHHAMKEQKYQLTGKRPKNHGENWTFSAAQRECLAQVAFSLRGNSRRGLFENLGYNFDCTKGTRGKGKRG